MGGRRIARLANKENNPYDRIGDLFLSNSIGIAESITIK